MAKYLTVLLGLFAVAFGFWAIFSTWPALWEVLKGSVPLVVTVAGCIAVFVGVAEIRDSKAEANRNKNNAS